MTKRQAHDTKARLRRELRRWAYLGAFVAARDTKRQLDEVEAQFPKVKKRRGPQQVIIKRA